MNNDTLHDQAVKLLIALKPTGTEAEAKDLAMSYNQRRRKATEALRPVLKAIWGALENGESVGGFQGKEAWCAGQSITMRRVQQIIAGDKQKAKSFRLKAGVKVILSGKDEIVLDPS
jgi:hypothetical protein